MAAPGCPAEAPTRAGRWRRPPPRRRRRATRGRRALVNASAHPHSNLTKNRTHGSTTRLRCTASARERSRGAAGRTSPRRAVRLGCIAIRASRARVEGGVAGQSQSAARGAQGSRQCGAARSVACAQRHCALSFVTHAGERFGATHRHSASRRAAAAHWRHTNAQAPPTVRASTSENTTSRASSVSSTTYACGGDRPKPALSRWWTGGRGCRAVAGTRATCTRYRHSWNCQGQGLHRPWFG